MDTGRKLKALEKAFADHLYATHKLPLWENRTLGLLSRPGESEADFRKCCDAAARQEAQQCWPWRRRSSSRNSIRWI